MSTIRTVLLFTSAPLLAGCGHNARPVVPAEPLVPCSYADTVGTDILPDEMPIMVTAPAPAYPAEARDQGIQGLVQMEFTIGRSGAVCKVTAVSSDTTGLLEQAAIDAALRWEFKPAKRNGMVVSSKVRAPVRFTLN